MLTYTTQGSGPVGSLTAPKRRPEAIHRCADEHLLEYDLVSIWFPHPTGTKLIPNFLISTGTKPAAGTPRSP